MQRYLNPRGYYRVPKPPEATRLSTMWFKCGSRVMKVGGREIAGVLGSHPTGGRFANDASLRRPFHALQAGLPAAAVMPKHHGEFQGEAIGIWMAVLDSRRPTHAARSPASITR